MYLGWYEHMVVGQVADHHGARSSEFTVNVRTSNDSRTKPYMDHYPLTHSTFIKHMLGADYLIQSKAFFYYLLVSFFICVCIYIYAYAHVCVVGSQVHVCKCIWRPEFNLNYCFLGAIYLDFQVESLTRICSMQFYEAGWPPSPIDLSVPIFQAFRLQSCDSTPGLFHDC